MKQHFDRPFVIKNPVFQFVSRVFYYLIAIPILYLIDVVFYGLRVEGHRQMKKLKGSGAIIVCNHMNNFDCTFLGMLTYPRKPIFTGMEQLFGWPFVGRLIRFLGCVPVPRSVSHTRKFLEEMAAEAGQNKQVICVYPEGELIPYCKTLRDFKDGAFTIAAKAEVPVLPVMIVQRERKGLYRLYKRKPCLTLRAGIPIYPDKEGSVRDRAKVLRQAAFDQMTLLNNPEAVSICYIQPKKPVLTGAKKKPEEYELDVKENINE